MHDPSQNPAMNPALSGRARRHFAGVTVAKRHFCSDRSTEEALAALRIWLRGKVAEGDVVSISMIGRRSIQLYRSHVATLDPQGVEQEKLEVRRHTRLPCSNPRTRAPRTRGKGEGRTLKQKGA